MARSIWDAATMDAFFTMEGMVASGQALSIGTGSYLRRMPVDSLSNLW